MFFPIVQLRLKMKLPAKSSKWTVTNSSFFMRALKWKRSVWKTSHWSCKVYVIMCLEWHLRSFLLPSLIVVSLFAFHCMLTLRTMCTSSVGGWFRKNYVCFFLCFLFFVFICFLFLYFVLIYVFVFVFYLCLVICCFVSFLYCLLFLFCCYFLFSVLLFYFFTIFTYIK